MNVYILSGCAGAEACRRYHATLGAAHAAAKDHVKVRPQDKFDVRIELADVVTDKAAILRMLNGEGGFAGPVQRTWRLGERGGVVECGNGD